MVGKIVGQPSSSRPPVRVGDKWWDAGSWDEMERRLERLRSGESRFISNEQLACELGLSREKLVRDLEMSHEEIVREFGMSREQLRGPLGLPDDDDDERLSA